MFFAGICNLTEKITHQFGTEICYHSYQKVQNTIQAINQSVQKLQTFNCKGQFATISPVSLTSYINFQQRKAINLKVFISLNKPHINKNPLRMISFKLMKKFVN